MYRWRVCALQPQPVSPLLLTALAHQVYGAVAQARQGPGCVLHTILASSRVQVLPAPG